MQLNLTKQTLHCQDGFTISVIYPCAEIDDWMKRYNELISYKGEFGDCDMGP